LGVRFFVSDCVGIRGVQCEASFSEDYILNGEVSNFMRYWLDFGNFGALLGQNCAGFLSWNQFAE
jgi:hypothetical protein